MNLDIIAVPIDKGKTLLSPKIIARNTTIDQIDEPMPLFKWENYGHQMRINNLKKRV